MYSLFLSLSLLASYGYGAVVSQISPGGSRLTGTSFGIPHQDATYDYVVVGGGTAGLVVASRLTQHSNASVAVVEAGSFYELSNGNLSQIPYYGTQGENADPTNWSPLTDWGLATEKQINGDRIHYAQGRNLGGSSGRNLMMWNYPSRGSYQAWADHVGDDSYTWENMKPFLERSLDFSANAARRPANATPVYDRAVFSKSGGPLKLSYPAFVNTISYFASKAFSSIGMNQIPGFTTGDLTGYGWWQFSIDPSTGLRSSSESSYFAHAAERPGLTTYINSQVRNIIFQNETATAVNVTNYGMQPFKISARKEVIVSAGPWHSPQLLMVSGVGPKETLEKYDIPVVSNLQGVGQNMWDSCNTGGVTFEIDAEGWDEDEAVSMLLSNASGPLTNVGIDAGAFEKLPDSYRQNLSPEATEALSAFPDDWPEIEYSLSSTSMNGKQYGRIGVVLVAATSRGNMTIQSSSNMDPPIINPNWLRDMTDQEVGTQGIRRAREAWKAISIRMGDEVSPGKNVTTDQQIRESITKEGLSQIHHASSSCAMGKSDNPDAVVDSKARVFGVKKLRVIDTSSFPFTPPGHTQAPVYAHAEKLVQDILDEMMMVDE